MWALLQNSITDITFNLDKLLFNCSIISISILEFHHFRHSHKVLKDIFWFILRSNPLRNVSQLVVIWYFLCHPLKFPKRLLSKLSISQQLIPNMFLKTYTRKIVLILAYLISLKTFETLERFFILFTYSMCSDNTMSHKFLKHILSNFRFIGP